MINAENTPVSTAAPGPDVFQRNSPRLEIVSRLAYALRKLGKKEAATALLREAQRVNPDDFWVNYDLAQSLIAGGRPDDASRFFTAAVAIRPRSEVARRGLREALRAAGRKD